jgi:hypothetical protein
VSTKRKGYAVQADGKLGKLFATVGDAQFAGEVSDHVGAEIVEVVVTIDVVKVVGTVKPTPIPSGKVRIPGLNA